MSGTIRVTYDEVFREVAEIFSNLLTEMDSVRNRYVNLQSQLDNVDSGTNAALKEAMERNKKKAETIELTMQKLSVFMRKSAINIEIEEKVFSSKFVYRM